MASKPKCIIKFKNGDFSRLREALLKDLSREYFAVLLGKFESAAGNDLINIHEIIFTPLNKYNVQRQAFLKLKKDFIHKALVEVTNRLDVDTILDVHTHPSCKNRVSFSSIDDSDESTFFKFIIDNFDLHYASIVLSRNEYSARIWKNENKKQFMPNKAVIKTQLQNERINSSDFDDSFDGDETELFNKKDSIFNRSVLALGLDTMRQIVNNQVVSVMGVGGLGSIIAEHLIHMGFHCINLVDHDIVEISNLNRIVGPSYEDALKGRNKVDAVKDHLMKINPNASVSSYALDINNSKIDDIILHSDWILVGTDNHSSRYEIQHLAFKYFVPFITAGVNITVNNHQIEDISGEVITVRMGDNYCLNCLGRVNFTKMAYENHPNKEIRDELVKRGYVTGSDVKEPAVKTLNSMLATMAVDELINQYTGIHKYRPILVYENNKHICIYEDTESLENRALNCFTCNI